MPAENPHIVMQLLAVGGGGCLGAICRFLVNTLMVRKVPAFPQSATLLVNVVGCLIIGFLMVYLERHSHLSAGIKLFLRLFLITGILGSLTTFSTYGYEVFALLEKQQLQSAIGFLLANLILGLVAVWLGIITARTFC